MPKRRTKRALARAAKRERKQQDMQKPSGESRYAKKTKGRKYDYSHLFRDCPQDRRATDRFLWTADYMRAYGRRDQQAAE